jgi:hypothetical protein
MMSMTLAVTVLSKREEIFAASRAVTAETGLRDEVVRAHRHAHHHRPLRDDGDAQP